MPLLGPGRPPFVLRVAGLPAKSMEPFSSPRLIARLEVHEHLRRQSEELRAALVACLHEAIPDAPKEKRGFLLGVKRDCFNARGLNSYRAHPGWALLADLAGGLASRLADLEAQAAAAEEAVEELIECELRREWAELIRLLDHQGFVRGVTLASPALALQLDRLKGTPCDRFGRRERRLALTLLRYASRAALKLSPFSSLTRTGIGRVDGGTGFELADAGAWREHPTACLHRELLGQCLCLLLHGRQLAERVPVRLNDTLETSGAGRYSFVRPARWELDHESKTFHYREEALVRVSLEGPLVPWLTAELGAGAEPCGSLLGRLCSRSGGDGADALRAGLDTLVRLGLLVFVFPWSATEPDLERRILEYLAALLPPSAELGAFTGTLRRLLDALDGYAASASPLRALELSRRGVEELFRAALPLAELDSSFVFKAGSFHFEEDVFLLPAAERTGVHEIARVSRAAAEEVLQDLDPLVRLSRLDNRELDFLHTLGAFAASRWPGARDVAFLELFGATRGLFRDYLQYRSQLSAHPPFLAPAFNPLQSAAVNCLEAWRRQIARELGACFERNDEGRHLCPLRLRRLLDQVPAPGAAPVEFCAFLQPLDATGSGWVLNALFEGYGRLSSRHTAAMDERTRKDWLAYFKPLSFFELDGERVELVDVSCPGRRTINVHAGHTARSLRLPGDPSATPARCRLGLKDLRVRLRVETELLALTDNRGQRLLPVQRGGLAPILSPTLLKFLALFGPGELRPCLPAASPRRQAGIEVVDRHSIGRVVYLRRQWILDPRPLLQELDGAGAGRALTAIHRWREAAGIPRRVFLAENTGAGKGRRPKPQFIDFSSPSLVHIFAAALRADSKVLVEALPAPEQFPGGEARWAVEMQLESFAIRLAPASTTWNPSRVARV
jgi:hypothetical protein